MAKYIVQQGDCISSIAYEYGFFPDTLWNLAENAGLKQKRNDPNVLFPGDEVFIPDRQEKTESGATEQRHRFKRKGVPEILQIRLMEDNRPRANLDYLLEIDGQWIRGTTDDKGQLKHCLPLGAMTATLRIGENEEIPIKLGHIDPISELSGVQGRLNNLGFSCGPIDGNLGPKTRAALRAFQAKHGLRETGEANDETRNKLVELYGA